MRLFFSHKEDILLLYFYRFSFVKQDLYLHLSSNFLFSFIHIPIFSLAFTIFYVLTFLILLSTYNDCRHLLYFYSFLAVIYYTNDIILFMTSHGLIYSSFFPTEYYKASVNFEYFCRFVFSRLHVALTLKTALSSSSKLLFYIS